MKPKLHVHTGHAKRVLSVKCSPLRSTNSTIAVSATLILHMTQHRVDVQLGLVVKSELHRAHHVVAQNDEAVLDPFAELVIPIQALFVEAIIRLSHSAELLFVLYDMRASCMHHRSSRPCSWFLPYVHKHSYIQQSIERYLSAIKCVASSCTLLQQIRCETLQKQHQNWHTHRDDPIIAGKSLHACRQRCYSRSV